jgi:Ca-activated chloride channel family protein
MGEAACHYHLKQYPKAAVIYIQAALAANSDAQRAAALFNLGNSYYKQADYVRAARVYRDTLRYRPGFAAAKTNLAYAEALQQKHTPSPSAVGGRAGTGYHTAPALPNTDVGKGRVSLDETSKPSSQAPPTAKGANAKLLQQAKAASQKVELDKDTQWTYDITRAQGISPADTRFAVDPSVFWQRLYEAEEGYPAPRQRPAVLPGVRPW